MKLNHKYVGINKFYERWTIDSIRRSGDRRIAIPLAS